MKRLFLAITTKIQTKNWRKLEKTTKIGLAHVNFIKQIYIEVERGVEYMNYQREVAILTDFCKKTVKRSKNEEINRKAKNKLKKIKKYAPIFNLKRIFRLCKTLWNQFPSLTFQYSIE